MKLTSEKLKQIIKEVLNEGSFRKGLAVTYSKDPVRMKKQKHLNEEDVVADLRSPGDKAIDAYMHWRWMGIAASALEAIGNKLEQLGVGTGHGVTRAKLGNYLKTAKTLQVTLSKLAGDAEAYTFKDIKNYGPEFQEKFKDAIKDDEILPRTGPLPPSFWGE